MQKYISNNKGFTLVEVIVVAVIVLILAAVAIPLYQGYVEDARQAAVENTASSIAKAVGSAWSLYNDVGNWDVNAGQWTYASGTSNTIAVFWDTKRFDVTSGTNCVTVSAIKGGTASASACFNFGGGD